MKKKLLLALADRLSTLDPDKYNTTSFHKDALFHAAQMPEFKKAGLRVIERSNDNGRPEPGGAVADYKGATDIEAASVLFDISNIEAQYLFGQFEVDVWGNPQHAPFGSTVNYHGVGLRRGRENEPPGWVAARIRTFVRDRSIDYMDRGPKAA